MRARRLPPLLVLALLLGQVPVAQAEGPTMTFRLIPETRTVEPGNDTSTTLEVRNGGVTAMRINFSVESDGVQVGLERDDVTLGAGQSALVRANVTTSILPAGGYNVTFRAYGQSTVTAVGPEESVRTFRITVAARNATRGNDTRPPDGPDDNRSRTDPPPDGGTPPPPPPPPEETPAPPPPADEEPEDDPAPGNETSGPTNDTRAGNGTATHTPPPQEPPPAKEEPPRPPGPPVLSPARLDLTGAPRQRVAFQVLVANPNAEAQTYDATLHLPIGWAGNLERASLLVPPNGTVALNGSVLGLPDARDADSLLAVKGPNGTATATLRLRLDRAPAPGAAPPAPALPAPDRGPGLARQDPPGPDADASDPAPAEGTLSVRIEPAEVRVPPGGRALAHLVVANGRTTPLDALPLVDLPDGFLLEPVEGGMTVGPGATLRIPLVLRAAGGLREGAGGEATARLDGADVTAPFRVLAAPAEASHDPAPTPSAPAPAPGPEASLVALGLAAAGGLALAGAWAWRRWHLGLFALYARLLPARVLEHPTRRAILDLVTREPGLRLADVQRRLGLANGALRHHVDRLEAAGHLRSVADGPHRRLHPPAAGRLEPLPGLAERALRLLEERGPLSASALAAALGVSRQALHYHVKKLAAEGRLSTARAGHELVLSLPSATTPVAEPAPALNAAPAPASTPPRTAVSAPRGGPSGPSP